MRNAYKLLLGTSAVLLMGLPLAAKEISYGGQVTVAMPTGALTGKQWLDGQVGGGAGVHMVVGFDGGHAIVPRFDYTYFKKSSDGVDRKVQTYQLGADYNYFLSKQVNVGPYLGGGLGVSAAKFELDGQGSSASNTPVTPYVAASGGWMFTRNLGAELRYTYAHYKPDVTGFAPRGFTEKPTVDSGTLNASFIFRF